MTEERNTRREILRRILTLGPLAAVAGALGANGVNGAKTAQAQTIGDPDVTVTGNLTVSGTGSSSFAGNVGIGTTGPGATLHVNGSNVPFKFRRTGGGGTGILTIDNVMAGDSTDAVFQVAHDTSSSPAGYAFQVRKNSADLFAMGINSDGKVGIGTTSPGSPLTVRSDSAPITIGGASGGSYDRSFGSLTWDVVNSRDVVVLSGTADAAIYANGSSRLLVRGDTGNVGIGTTSPAARLTVYGGDLHVGDGNNFNPYIQNAGSGRTAATPGYTFYNDFDTGMFIPNAQDTLAFSTGGTERVRIDSSGNIGIGGSPLDRLHIFGTGSSNGIRIGDSSNTGDARYIRFQGTPDQSDSYFAKIYMDRDTASGYKSYLAFYTQANGAGSHSDNSVEAMRIDSSGKVGIGTTAPGGQLDVRSVVGVGLKVQQGITGDLAQFWSDVDGTGSQVVTIQRAGNVGIGTTSPTAKLEVSGGDIRVTGGEFKGRAESAYYAA